MELKAQIIEHIKGQIAEKIAIAKHAMEEAQRSANEETKSSAGDKYETGRAMAQNERDKYAGQLALLKIEMNQLETINFYRQFGMVLKGALVETEIGFILLSISIGQITIQGKNVMVVSNISPIGKAIWMKKVGERIEFIGKTISILAIH